MMFQIAMGKRVRKNQISYLFSVNQLFLFDDIIYKCPAKGSGHVDAGTKTGQSDSQPDKPVNVQ
jgi:hypothetical protein